MRQVESFVGVEPFAGYDFNGRVHETKKFPMPPSVVDKLRQRYAPQYAYLEAEFGGEGADDHWTKARLKDVFGEVIGRSQKRGAADKSDGAGQSDEGTLLGGKGSIGECAHGSGPDLGEVSFVIHSASPHKNCT
jgi:hypothetical protein